MASVIIITCFSHPFQYIYSIIQKIISTIALKSLYTGFKTLVPTLASSRVEVLVKSYGAQKFACANEEGKEIEAFYIKAAKACNSVVVICLNTTFQDHRPKYWEPFLENGADILLWNPTKVNPINYSKDLFSLLKTLRRANSDQLITVKAYCAGVDPAIKAVAKTEDPKVNLIIDRGYGDIKQLATSFTLFARLKIVKQTLGEEFDCKGIEEIKKIRGNVIFLIPEKPDQVMDYGRRNLTKDLSERKKGEIISISPGHWTKWDYKTYNKVIETLSRFGILRNSEVSKEAFPEPKPLSFFERRCLPFLIKSWI